jgi:hypothetical protein
MGTPAVKVGVALGMLAAVVSFFPIFILFMGDCFFEQGCGRHENAQVIGIALASGLVGLVAAWGVARLVGMKDRREH